MEEPKIREARVAGRGWYSGDPEGLRREIDAYLGRTDHVPTPPGRLLGLLAPHAGYQYSGAIAAAAYKQLAGRAEDYDLVVLLGTSHTEPYGALLYTGDYFRTPLGRIPVDKQLAEELSEGDEDFVRNHHAHEHDHSLEMQLPFLQSFLTGWKLLPILVGNARRDTFYRMGNLLGRKLRERRALVVISTDLSHYPSAEDAERIDRAALSALSLSDIDGMLDTLDELRRQPIPNLSCVICGLGAVTLGLSTLRALGASRIEVLDYHNSAKASGDTARVVGYGAAAFYADNGDNDGELEEENEALLVGSGPMLSAGERQEVLEVARASLTAAVHGEEYHPPTAPEGSALARPLGAFVCIKVRGELRGCIGRFEPDAPLLATIADMARSAGLEDRRLAPVTRDDLSEIDLEVSVLSPLTPVRSPEEIEVGRHGVLISQRGRRGTLLPQVATERGWDRETLLTQTCQKAGLHPQAWKEPETEIEVYTAEIFSGPFAAHPTM